MGTAVACLTECSVGVRVSRVSACSASRLWARRAPRRAACVVRQTRSAHSQDSVIGREDVSPIRTGGAVDYLPARLKTTPRGGFQQSCPRMIFSEPPFWS